MSDIRLSEPGSDVRQGGLLGLEWLPGCPATLFLLESGVYRAVFRQNYAHPFEYGFLRSRPDLWAPAFEEGCVLVPGNHGLIPGHDVWVAIDPLGEPDRLLVVELPAGQGIPWLLRATLRNWLVDQAGSWLQEAASAL